MLSPTPPQTPGIYPGSGLASLLRANEQAYLFQNQLIVAGQASIAVQLERIKSGFYYPWGAAFQATFSGAPGSSPEVDIQFSESDTDATFVTVGTITVFNTGNVGRYDMPNTVFPKYVRGIVKTLANVVNTTLIVTH